MKELVGELLPRDELSQERAEEMFALLEQSFENVFWGAFLKDLVEKDEVFLLRDQERLVGFSTIKFFDHNLNGKSYRVIFSGDTIISPPYWGSLQLPVLWGVRMMDYWEQEPERPLVWMLISKGIRTFKFLPTFFKSYYPAPGVTLPSEVAELRNSLGELRFPGHYDKKTGLVLPLRESYFLRPELAEPPLGALSNEKTRFFLESNPTYRTGSELLCLSYFTPENLRPFIRRQIEVRRKQFKRELAAA